MADFTHERRARDDMELSMLKFAALGGALGLTAATIGDVAAGVILFAAVGAAVEWVLRKIIRPLVRLAWMLEGLRPWMKHTDEELAEIKHGAIEAAKRAEHAMNIAEAVKRQLGVTARDDDE